MTSYSVADRLPVEIIAEILSYLTASDVKVASAVSWRWYEASQTPCIARKLRMRFSRASSLPDIMLALQQRTVYDIHIASLVGTSSSQSVFTAACMQFCLFATVERLSLRGCDISEALLYSVLASCNCLVALDLSSCNNLFMSGQLLKDLHANSHNTSNSNTNNSYSFCDSISDENLKDTLCAEVNMNTPRRRGIFSIMKQKLLFNRSSKKSSSSLNKSVMRGERETQGSRRGSPLYDSCSSLSDHGKDIESESAANESADLMNDIRVALESVKELKLASLRYLSDVTFSRLMIACPSLTHLSLANNSIVFHADIYSSNEACGGIASSCGITNSDSIQEPTTNEQQDKIVQRDRPKPNSAVLSFSYVLNFIAARAGNLMSLDFSRTTISNEYLKRLVTLSGLKLQELFLAGCHCIGDDGIISVTDKQTSIKVLDVTECVMITDRGVIAICSKLKDLTCLSVAKCRQLTDVSAYHLQSLTKLNQLDMSACSLVSSKSLNLVLSKCFLITKLSLAQCTAVHDGLLLPLQGRSYNLVSIDLSSCSITDMGFFELQKLTSHSLLHLRLAWCGGITDISLLGAKSIKKNGEGNTASCREGVSCHDHDEQGDGACKCTRKNAVSSIFNAPTSNSAEALVEIKYPDSKITELKKLRTLDLSSCYRLSDSALSQIMIFSELTCLCLSLCRSVTDRTLNAIGKGIPILESLFIAQCYKVTDDGFIGLIKKLDRLRLLDISSCDQLTSRTIEALYVHSRCLQELDVSLCSRISAQSVEMLENNRLSLQVVHKRMIGSRAF